MGKKKKLQEVAIREHTGEALVIERQIERDVVQHISREDIGWENPKVVRAQALGMAVSSHSFSDDQKILTAAQAFAAFIEEGTVPEPAEVTTSSDA